MGSRNITKSDGVSYWKDWEETNHRAVNYRRIELELMNWHHLTFIEIQLSSVGFNPLGCQQRTII